MAGPQPLESVRHLQQALADPNDRVFARCEFPAEPAPHGWVLGRSAAVARTSHSGRSGFVLLGEETDLVTLVDDPAARSELAGATSLTVPRTVLPAVARSLPLTDGGDWDWLYTPDAPAVQPAEDRLVELDDAADAAELIALNELGNPTAESFPGTGRTELWLGIREPTGAIVAAGAVHRTAGGAPHLSGIVTHPDHRGRGLGLAVIAGLTRAALQLPGPLSGVSTLGMYAVNDGARRLYHRLGYRTAQRFASRMLIRNHSRLPVS